MGHNYQREHVRIISHIQEKILHSMKGIAQLKEMQPCVRIVIKLNDLEGTLNTAISDCEVAIQKDKQTFRATDTREVKDEN